MTPTAIGITWDEGVLNGGTPVTSYRISYDQGSNNYIVLATGVTTTTYQATTLVTGKNYKFKVESKNSFGYSTTFSNEVTILQAVEPETPTAPVTSVLADKVIINWDAPYWNGAEVTTYRIFVQASSGGFISAPSSGCDGTDTFVVENTQCTVDLTDLYAVPYSLVQGDSVFAKIIANNLVGDSDESPFGNGAIIVLVPDSPITVVNVAAITN